MGWARPYRSSIEVTLRSMRSTSSAGYAVSGSAVSGNPSVRPGAVGVILRDRGTEVEDRGRSAHRP